MRDIKLWKLILIWVITLFVLSITYGLLIDVKHILISDEILNVLLFTCLLVVTLLYGKVNLNCVKEKLKNLKTNINKKEMVLVIITQIFLSLGLSYLSIGIIAINNKGEALKYLNDTMGNPTNNMELILFLVTIIILAPLLEEIIFRRIIFSKLNKKLGFVSSAIISSIIFGIGHDTLGILGAIVFGITCCILYRKYKNLTASITLHFFNNLLSGIITIFYYFSGTLNEKISSISNGDIRNWMIEGIILTIVTLLMFYRFVKENKKVLYI